MHMADALISPAVGGAMWLATAALTTTSARRLKEEMNERKVPLMGVLGAFVFAAQMINFTIPGTGSSGHLGGGLLLAALLGPSAAFLTMASILTVQALFFADGGLLALGCNIINLGLFPCFIAYPLIFRPLAGRNPSQGRMLAASMVAAVLGLQMGAFGVVLETLFSGISELPFTTFVLLMQPIHLAIGIVEGLVTALVAGFLLKARPEVLEVNASPAGAAPLKHILVGLLVVAALTGGVLSWFASSNPDGLEWAMLHTAGQEELAAPESGLHALMAAIQEKTAILPDYAFKDSGTPTPEPPHDASWPAVNAGSTVSGMIGGVITMLLAGAIGLGLRRLKAAARS